MATTTTFRPDHGDMGGNRQMSHSSGNFDLPYDDPAIVNPAELASFPKVAMRGNQNHTEHESHLVNRRTTPARDGRNITRTW
ncbi:hypothetical protein ACLI09_03030 [Flavobacterium sp. RHBU_24]|uniref:hypothetical protein n=1 Tax=Flavobacterium sp. RHBU_24 TaxID=3391185 RepID=UPI003984A053